MNRLEQSLVIPGLLYEVAGAAPHSLHRDVNGSPRSHHHNRRWSWGHRRHWSWGGVGVVGVPAAAPAVAAPAYVAPAYVAPVRTGPACYTCGGWTQNGCYMTYRKVIDEDGNPQLKCVEACDEEPAAAPPQAS